jgi:hypothetical protein
VDNVDGARGGIGMVLADEFHRGRRLVKIYRSGKSQVRALDGLELVVPEASVLGLGPADTSRGLSPAIRT